METKVSEIVRILEDLASIPIYSVIGCSGKGVILYGLHEGISSVSVFDTESRKIKRLSKYSVAEIARPLPGVDKIIYTRDIAKGAEKHEIRFIDINEETDEKLIENIEPMRVVGMAYDGKDIAFTGVTEKAISVFHFDGKKIDKIVDLPGMGFVTSLKNRIVVGNGSLQGDPKSMELFTVNLDKKKLDIITPKPGSINKLPVVYENKIYFESNAEGKNSLMIYDLDSQKFSKILGKGDYAKYDPTEHLLIDFIDDKLIIIGKKNGRAKAFVNWKEVPSPEGTVNGITLCGGHVYASVTSLKFPSKIVKSTMGPGEYEVVYEPSISNLLENRLNGRVTFTKIESSDGVKVPTFVIEVSKGAPTVIYVHGGPWSEVMDEWRIMISSLVALGFNVVAPNFRGSTGYGEKYRLMDIGDPGGGDLEDVAAAAKWAMETGLANKDKIYIMGYSYGGYMTLWSMVSKPGLFKCGAAGAAISDWEEMYELSDAIFREFIDMLFAGKKELLKERSPISKFRSLKDPLCIVQNQNDTRTPLKPMLRFVEKLQDLGKKYELHVIPDMGHIINSVDDAVKILLPLLLFLKRCSS